MQLCILPKNLWRLSLVPSNTHILEVNHTPKNNYIEKNKIRNFTKSIRASESRYSIFNCVGKRRKIHSFEPDSNQRPKDDFIYSTVLRSTN